MAARLTNRRARGFEYQLIAIAAGCALVVVLALTVFPSALAGGPPWVPVTPILHAVAVVFAVVALLVLAGSWVHHRCFFSARQRLRRDLGDEEGWVDESDMRTTCGPAAVLAEAERFWRRPRSGMTIAEASWEIGELFSGRWTLRSRPMLAAYPRSALVLGPQGGGKSQYLIPRILDAPGPALVTSTKVELINATAAFRGAHVGPVVIFDPLNMTGGGHNMPFDPVWGCSRVDPDAASSSLGGVLESEYADVMATAMIRGASLSKKMNEEFWADIGREILRCYLFAADLIGEGSMTVQRWVHDPDDPQPLTILRQAGDRVPPGWLSLLQQRLATNRRQRDGYFATVSSCLEYLAIPGARAACRASRQPRPRRHRQPARHPLHGLHRREQVPARNRRADDRADRVDLLPHPPVRLEASRRVPGRAADDVPRRGRQPHPGRSDQLDHRDPQRRSHDHPGHSVPPAARRGLGHRRRQSHLRQRRHPHRARVPGRRTHPRRPLPPRRGTPRRHRPRRHPQGRDIHPPPRAGHPHGGDPLAARSRSRSSSATPATPPWWSSSPATSASTGNAPAAAGAPPGPAGGATRCAPSPLPSNSVADGADDRPRGPRPPQWRRGPLPRRRATTPHASTAPCSTRSTDLRSEVRNRLSDLRSEVREQLRHEFGETNNHVAEALAQLRDFEDRVAELSARVQHGATASPPAGGPGRGPAGPGAGGPDPVDAPTPKPPTPRRRRWAGTTWTAPPRRGPGRRSVSSSTPCCTASTSSPGYRSPTAGRCTRAWSASSPGSAPPTSRPPPPNPTSPPPRCPGTSAASPAS